MAPATDCRRRFHCALAFLRRLGSIFMTRRSISFVLMSAPRRKASALQFAFCLLNFSLFRGNSFRLKATQVSEHSVIQQHFESSSSHTFPSRHVAEISTRRKLLPNQSNQMRSKYWIYHDFLEWFNQFYKENLSSRRSSLREERKTLAVVGTFSNLTAKPRKKKLFVLVISRQVSLAVTKIFLATHHQAPHTIPLYTVKLASDYSLARSNVFLFVIFITFSIVNKSGSAVSEN